MIIDEEDYLMHHGVKGQKWGVRRAQEINAKRAAKGKDPLKPSQFVGNRTARGAAYVAGFMLGSNAGLLVGQLAGGSQTASVIGSSAFGIAGVIATNKLLKDIGNKRISEIRNEKEGAK